MTLHGRAGEYLDGVLDPDVESEFLAHLAECAECQDTLHAEIQLRDLEDLASGTSTEPHAQHGAVGEYLDGDLDGAAEEAFLDHLAACAMCQRVLHEEIQLRDREEILREMTVGSSERRVPLASREVIELPNEVRPPRWRVTWGAGGTLATAAVAVLVLFSLLPPDPVADPVKALAVALKPNRAVEIRLSHPAAAKHRPYDTMRSSGPPSEPIAPAVIAQLDAAHDCRGVATAYVLTGAWHVAEETYRACPAGLDIDADRAGLAVLLGQTEDALELTERVLEVAPDHAVALWNRALALRALGLGLAATTAFERVAALEKSHDPAWAQEASTRAADARAELDRMRVDYLEVERLGKAMALGGPALDTALARRVPARARIWLHNALRTATTAAQIDRLAPLAAALEGLQGEGLSRYVEQARAQLSPARTAASAGYRQFVIDDFGAVDDRVWERWLAAATRAGLDDLILGTRLAFRRLDGVPSADQLADATRDPWFELAIEILRAQEALVGGRVEDGAARLAAIEAQCPSGATSFRCLQLAVALAELELKRDRLSEIMRHAATALALSRRLGEWPQRAQALTWFGNAARLAGNFASARGYLEEAVHARVLSDKPCDARELTFSIAAMLYQRHRLAQAHTLAAAAPACDQPPKPVELTALTQLLRSGHVVIDRAPLLAEIARARAANELPGDRLLLDFLVEWLALDMDRDRLAQIATAAQLLEGAPRVKLTTFIDGALFAHAARRGAWSDALAVVARARSVLPPARCALAFGADDFRFAVIAVGRDGAITGRYEPDRMRSEEWLAPESMRRAVDGCDEVVVLALPAWLGIGPVLDASTPWSYVLGPPLPSADGNKRHVAITEPVPPASTKLAPLMPRVWPPPPTGPDEIISGQLATPERVLSAISDATLVEIHSHALTMDPLDAPVLALSPGASGWTLDAAMVATATLTSAPIVVLADCSGGVAARFEHRTWGLPLAFRTAGARAVIAALSAIPDRDAAELFGAVVAELKRDVSPASAVAKLRAEKLHRDPTSWVRHVVVFQ